jgi:hypothetical protein
MDTSLFWGQPMRNSLDLEMDGLLTSYDNLSTGLRPWSVIINPNQTRTFTLDESAHYDPVPGGEPFGPREAKWTPDRHTAKYLMGVGDDERPRVFRHGRPAWNGLLALMSWTMASAFAAWRLLSRKREE